jgi:hypothetical protein
MRIIDFWVLFAISMNLSAIYFTCAMLHELQARSLEYITLIESTITSSTLEFSIVSAISSRLLEFNICIF